MGVPKTRGVGFATDAEIAVVKEESVLDATEAANGSHMSIETVPAQKAFLQAATTMCCVHNDDFQNKHERRKLQGDKGLPESINILMCNPPYDVSCQQALQNSDHDVFNGKDEEAFCKFTEKVLKRGVHGLISRFTIQVSASWRQLCALTEAVKENVTKMAMFEVRGRRCSTVVSTVLMSETHNRSFYGTTR